MTWTDWLTLSALVLSMSGPMPTSCGMYTSALRMALVLGVLQSAWTVFCSQLLASYADPHRSERAERAIQSRIQMPNESVMK